MTISGLAALLAIAGGLWVWRAGNRMINLVVALGFITLGYISGNTETTVGGWVHSLIDVVTSVVDTVSGGF